MRLVSWGSGRAALPRRQVLPHLCMAPVRLLPAVRACRGSRLTPSPRLPPSSRCRRLLQNPSYYDLESTEQGAVSAYLSALVEGVLVQLQDAGCLEVGPLGLPHRACVPARPTASLPDCQPCPTACLARLPACNREPTPAWPAHTPTPAHVCLPTTPKCTTLLPDCCCSWTRRRARWRASRWAASAPSTTSATRPWPCLRTSWRRGWTYG